MNVGGERLNLVTGDRYIQRLNKLLYLTTGKNFEEKETNFRAHLLDEALAKCGGIVTATANYLGIIHQTLSFMLKKFPELLEKHQVKLRHRSSNKLIQKKSVPPEDSFALQIETNRLAHIGLTKGKIIGVRRCSIDALDLSKPVVIKDGENKYHCGFLVDALGMYAFEDGLGNMERIFLPDEIVESGQVIGLLDAKTNSFIPLKK